MVSGSGDGSGAPGTQTLLRGLAALQAVGDGARTLKQIGERLGTTRSTTHRLVSSLLAERYLRIHQGDYFLGARLVELGFQAREQMPLAALSRPYLENLSARTGDAIHLGVRDGSDVLYLDKIAGQRGLEMRSRVGQRMPLALTGIGKALLLDATPAEWQHLFEMGEAAMAVAPALVSAHSDVLAGMSGVDRDPLTMWPPQIGQTPVARRPLHWPDLLDRLHRYAEAGYAFDLEDNEPSIRCVAAPIRDASGAIVAAISVASTVPYMPLERMEALRYVVVEAAVAISAELGFKVALAI